MARTRELQLFRATLSFLVFCCLSAVSSAQCAPSSVTCSATPPTVPSSFCNSQCQAQKKAGITSRVTRNKKTDTAPPAAIQAYLDKTTEGLNQRLAHNSAAASARIDDMQRSAQAILDSASAPPASNKDSLLFGNGIVSKLALAATPVGPVDSDLLNAISNCAADPASCIEPNLTADVQTPEASDLIHHIPMEGRKDPQIQLLVQEYDRYESHRLQKEQEIVDVGKMIQASDPSADVLKAYQADLTNQSAQDRKMEDATLQTIHDRTVNIGLVWTEDLPKPPSKP